MSGLYKGRGVRHVIAMPQIKLRLATADLATGRAAEQTLLGALAAEPLAVTLFESTPPAFVLEVYLEVAPVLQALRDALAPLGPGVGALTLEAVPDENWVAVSQAALPPIRAGRFVVHGAHDRARAGFARAAIEIEAGEAFGTGHNGTTAGCLAAIDALAKHRRFHRILDLGCGTALLALAAARAFPAARILAGDNDPIATAVARENVRLNRAARRIRIVTATGLAHPALRAGRPYDLILANILPNTLIALAAQMRRVLASGGACVLSGILDHQAAEVRAAYAAQGFRLLTQRRREGWTILTLQRR